MYAQGEEIVLAYSVARLCQQAAQYNVEFYNRGSNWSVLDGYYIPTRYPNGLPDGIPAHVFTKKAAQDAVAMAGEAVEFVGNLLIKVE